MQPVDAVIDAVERLDREAGAVVVVALDGRSAAGKSMLGRLLADRLDASLVAMDDFYADIPARERLELDARGGMEHYFDWRRVRADALAPLRAHRRARYRHFDWERGEGLGGWRDVPWRPVVLLEGVTSARPELADLVDLTVLVEARATTRAARLRARREHPDWSDAWDGWDVRWDAAEDLYFSEIRPQGAFALVVSGEDGGSPPLTSG